MISARPRKNSDQLGPGGGLPTGTPDRSGRPRSRGPGGVSQSQPGSRSASPSSIKSYHTYFTDNQSTPFGSSTVRISAPVESGQLEHCTIGNQADTNSMFSGGLFYYSCQLEMPLFKMIGVKIFLKLHMKAQNIQKTAYFSVLSECLPGSIP